MVWAIKYSDVAVKQLKKMDKQYSSQILKYMHNQVSPLKDPRSVGKPLLGKDSGLWRYRSGDYRIICEIQDTKLIIAVIRLGNRKNVYKNLKKKSKK